MQDPQLPLELERVIFLMAFRADFNDVKNLVLVAKRAHDWYALNHYHSPASSYRFHRQDSS